MVEMNFIKEVSNIYSKWIFVEVFIADVAMMGIVILFAINLWQLFPIILIPAVYMMTWGSPRRYIRHFIDNYMAVGKPQSMDAEFLKRTMTRFDIFGLRSPWKYYDALFV